MEGGSYYFGVSLGGSYLGGTCLGGSCFGSSYLGGSYLGGSYLGGSVLGWLKCKPPKGLFYGAAILENIEFFELS